MSFRGLGAGWDLLSIETCQHIEPKPIGYQKHETREVDDGSMVILLVAKLTGSSLGQTYGAG